MFDSDAGRAQRAARPQSGVIFAYIEKLLTPANVPKRRIGFFTDEE